MGEEHDSDAGPTVSRGNPTGEPKRNQLEIELVGVRGGGPRSKQVSVSVSHACERMRIDTTDLDPGRTQGPEIGN